ncbi:hypothetical protein [Rhizomonospora bruguierae]|uniref:hypothetical protein n=1 Tax=Rhizomonospora bruguierae TaxID=1581705 RepID=UPI001BCAFC20|nr:hypothetical protein [Micromonospora sp. NBRC 107566]
MLVVTGFAAVAWLLGTAAAQADRGTSTLDDLVVGAQPAVSLGAVLPEADRLTGADAPVAGPVLRAVGAAVVPIAQTGAAGSAGTATLVGDVVRPVGRAVSGAGRAVAPVTRLLDQAAAHVAHSLHDAPTGTGTSPAGAVRRGAPASFVPAPTSGTTPMSAARTAPAGPRAANAVYTGRTEGLSTPRSGASLVGHVPWLDPASVAGDRTAPAGGSGTPFLPDRPLAPMQAHLGGGAAAPGTGTHHDGDPNAIVGAPSAAGTADARRLRAGAEDAAVRREPARPAVSPD